MSKKLIKQRFFEEEGGFVKSRSALADDSNVVSQFLITYNTNQAPTSEASEQMSMLHGTMKNKLSFWKNVMKIAPVGKSYATATQVTSERTVEIPENANLKDEIAKGFRVSVKAVEMEVGPEKKRLHGHCLVKITHKSRLHIDASKFKQMANDVLSEAAENRGTDPISISYVNIKWIPHSSYAVRNYVNKNKFERVFERGHIANIAEQ